MLIADRYKPSGTNHLGGMAQVLICKDTVLERTVAIKAMPGSSNRRRVIDEIRALLQMRSKHVVQIYDIFEFNNNDLAIIQEYIDGEDLFDENLAPKTVAEYLKTIWQIASGIADIHHVGVIHRDIKPNNMKMDPEGVIKIFDFGLARNEGNSAATIGFIGTKGFAAPELYGHDVKFTPAVDTFAFGSTALFIATRDLPGDLLLQPPHISEINYFSKLPFFLDGEITETLNACLNPCPSLRPSMRDVRDLLAKHLLFDRHKALVVYNGQPSYLDCTRRSVSLRLPSIAEITIEYDGLSFKIQHASGEVFINNQRACIGESLPGACVVALGGPERRNHRKFITFDLSHPEIVL